MNLRVRILHFVDGIGALGGRMSIASEPVAGVPAASNIKRIGEGYLIEYKGKLFVVHDVQIRCAEVVDADAANEVVELQETEPSVFTRPAIVPTPPRPPGPPPGMAPGELYLNDQGQYTRVPYPDGKTKEQYEKELQEQDDHPDDAPVARFKPGGKRKRPAPASKVDEK